MFSYLSKRKAQTTMEYAVLIGVLVAGLIAMQVYVKRGFQGKLRESADSMGTQFSPKHTTYSYTTTSESKSNENLDSGITTTTIDKQISDKKGDERVDVEGKESWFENK